MPLFDPANTAPLKAWLAVQLDGICDADPEVLSDYVMALLKHDSTEADLQEILKEQLEDFLNEHTDAFVTSVLAALRSESYLPQASRKRRAEEEATQEQAAPPPKAPRASTGQATPSASTAAAPNNAAATTAAPRAPSIPNKPAVDPRAPRGPNGRGKELCRDYHQKGFCARGIDCRYEHSSDMLVGAGLPSPPTGPAGNMRASPNAFGGAPFVPGNGGLPFAPQGMMPNGASPQGMPPLRLGRQPYQAAGPQSAFGMQPQAWQPQQQQQHGGEAGSSLAARMSGQIQGAYVPQGGFAGGNMQQQRPPPQQHAQPYQQQQPHQPQPPHQPQQQQQAPPPHMRGFQPGGGAFRQARSQTALVLENVPVEHLELITINDYFKRFGTITNIQIDKAGSKALVDFASPEQAKAAHGCPDAVFGNRFVKIWFQRIEDAEAGNISAPSNFNPTPSSHHAHAQPFQQVERSKPANLANGQNVYTAPGSSSSSGTSYYAANAARQKAQQAQRATQDALDLLLTEQKRLFLAVSGAGATPEGRKAAMSRLRAIEGEIKTATEKAKEAAKALAALPKVEQSATGAGGTMTPEELSKMRELKEKKEREQLDRELDMHGKSEESTTEELKAKLESLKAEAASLGIDANGSSAAAASSSRGAYRGRGATRGAARGSVYTRGGARGGAVAGRMTLDNRPTKLVVSELPEAKEEREKVKEHFKSFGETTDITESPAGFTIAYKARAAGEAALRAGTDVPGVGTSVKLAWVPATSAAASNAASAAASEVSTPQPAETKETEKEGEDEWNP